MYEDMTFENIMNRCLSRVSSGVDKREGSVIYDALAPAVAEIAIMYAELSTLMDRAFPDTATGADLTLKASERGIMRRSASRSIRRGEFRNSQGALMNIPIGARFSGGNVNYTAISQISTGYFRLQAEEAGEIGNAYFGTLLPITFVSGLASATLSDVLIPGENEESDEDLRKRYYDSLQAEAYGGNQQDYKDKVTALQGVGSVKIFPTWNGGGTVKLIIVDSEWHSPSQMLIDTVQAAVDPTQNNGEGLGIAPIGHVVTVEGAVSASIDISTQIQLQNGYTWEMVEPYFTEAINAYFVELAQIWANEDNLVVRISQVETRALEIQGIIDIGNTALNGIAANLVLEANEIPVLGTVIV